MYESNGLFTGRTYDEAGRQKFLRMKSETYLYVLYGLKDIFIF